MKLRRKLLSAGFALGATALTLTTSTFAWYTSNTEVVVDSIKGATSATADSSSLFIAAATGYSTSTTSGNDPQTYVAPGAKVTSITTYATTQTPTLLGNASKRVLTPVAFHGANQYGTLNVTNTGYEYSYASTTVTADTFGNGKYYTTTDSDDVTKYTAASTYVSTETYYTRTATKKADTVTYTDDSTGAYVYEYVLRFQKPNATASTPIYVSAFSLVNTATSDTSKQQALAYDNQTEGANTGVSAAGQYNVDMLHALKMTVVATNLTSAGDYPTGELTSTTKVYDLDGFAQASKDSANIGASANAVGYYNAVLGTNISKPTDYLTANESFIDGVACIAASNTGASDNSGASHIFTIPDTGFVEVRFTFWLDGWDEFCYDVCQKQNFEVQMNFSTSEDKSILTTATAAKGKKSA